MIQPRPHVAALSVYGLASLDIPAGMQLVSLAQNESPFPPSPLAFEAARKTAAEGALYPDPSCMALRTAIGEVQGLDPADIICSAGSMEIIAALIAAFSGPDDEVLSSAHAYSYFKTAAMAVGASPVAADEVDLTVSVDHLIEAVTPATRIVCIANPGNPSGTRISGAEVRRLRDELPSDVILLVDEAYAEFGPDDPVFDLVGRGDTCITRTFSKAYALAGMRVGWGLFPRSIGDEVWKLLNPGGVSATSLAAAAAAMRDQAYMQELVSKTVALRDPFIARMNALGLTIAPSHTNFALIQLPSVEAATSADAALRSEGVVMRPMGGYGLPHCLRVTVGLQQEMDFAHDILRQWTESNA
ncbi:MAG: histidinol-phosphate transaminase [Pseudomonadota bacterium]